MPQHAKRIKIRRKDLRKPDEFETLTGQAFGWIEEHRPLVAGVAGAVGVAALAMLAVGHWRATRNATAAADFRSAQAAFEAGQNQESARAFAAVAEIYPRAPFGRLAVLYRAHALARAGDAAGAAVAYGEYLASSPATDYLRQEALTGLAHAREASGDTAAALDAYTQAAALDGPFRTDASLAAARLQEASGHADQAKEIYARLLREAPDPETKAFLATKLPPGTVTPDETAPGTTANVAR
jgi:tetratricopeptide (TPR) repeat protein